MLHGIETYITLFGAGVSILASIGQIIITGKRKENYTLSVLFLTMGILLVQCTSVFTGYSRSHPWILCYHLTLIWFMAPVLYLTYFNLVNSGDKHHAIGFKLFLPATLAFLLDTATILAYRAGLIPNLLWIFHDKSASWLIVKKYLLIAGALQIIIYLIVFMARMLPDWSFRRRNVILDITLFYSLSSLATTGFLVAGYITADVLYLKITALIGAFSTIFIYPLGQRYPRFYQILQTEAKERRYKKSLLGGLNVDLIMEHLTALMETERLYEDETITLKDLAERLLITPHQLSQLLNDTLHTNFNNFVNRYRITEAERILIDDPRRPVLTIAFDVGFNNKTSFYDAFSRFNGMSPHRYRKEKLRK